MAPTVSRFGDAEDFDPWEALRWTIENQRGNDAKTRYGLEHLCHHAANSLLITWLLTAFALTIERLYRLRDGIYIAGPVRCGRRSTPRTHARLGISIPRTHVGENTP